jgi:hypothetical protein
MDAQHFPLEPFRLAVAHVLEAALGIPCEAALAGVELGKKGCDFTVALPRFRLKSKPEDLLQLVSNAVCDSLLDNRRLISASPSFHRTSTSKGLWRMAHSSISLHARASWLVLSLT